MRIGLDVGGTKIAALAIDDDGSIVARVRRTTGHGEKEVLTSIIGATEELLESASAPVGAIRHIGLGIPGLVDAEEGTVRHAVNLRIGEEPFEIRRLLSEHFGGAPVSVDNDLNVGALGAAALLGYENVDLAYLAIGTGLAAGIVLHGEPRTGAHGATGEIGHIPVNPMGERCPCGQRGCLETVASGTALTRKWPTSNSQPAPAALFREAQRGNAEAQKVKAEFIGGVVQAVQMTALSIDVDIAILGGGVSELGEPLLTAVQEELRARARESHLLATLNLADKVQLLPPGSAAAAVGAAILGREKTDTVPSLKDAQGPRAETVGSKVSPLQNV